VERYFHLLCPPLGPLSRVPLVRLAGVGVKRYHLLQDGHASANKSHESNRNATPAATVTRSAMQITGFFASAALRFRMTTHHMSLDKVVERTHHDFHTRAM